jgi:CRP/FNR family transcriptional regulator, cyclic AMP receptor protein
MDTSARQSDEGESDVTSTPHAVPGAGRGRRTGGWNWPAGTFLGDLPAESRERLFAVGAQRQYPADKILIREHELSEDNMFVLVLLDGLVKVTGLAQDAREALVAVRVGGELVGEFGALDHQRRSATVTTCGAVTARVISQRELADTMRRDSRLADSVNRSILGKMREANTRLIDFAGCDVPTRLARILLELATLYGVEQDDGVAIQRMTQPELASLVGAAEPTIHKAMRRLREDAIASPRYGKQIIHDLERLRRVAYPEPD